MTVLNSNRVELPIKEALRNAFPEIYPKKTSIADSLAEPSSIIDFDVIRNNSEIGDQSSSSIKKKDSKILTEEIKIKKREPSDETMRPMLDDENSRKEKKRKRRLSMVASGDAKMIPTKKLRPLENPSDSKNKQSKEEP